MQELRIHAGLQRTEVRGQSGDKKGTKRGHSLYVKKITHSYLYWPVFLLALPHALPCFEALPFALAGAASQLDAWPRCLPLPGAQYRTVTACNRPPRKWPRKGFPHGPTFGGAAVCPDGLLTWCSVWWPRPALWRDRVQPVPCASDGRAGCLLVLALLCGGKCGTAPATDRAALRC